MGKLGTICSKREKSSKKTEVNFEGTRGWAVGVTVSNLQMNVRQVSNHLFFEFLLSWLQPCQHYRLFVKIVPANLKLINSTAKLALRDWLIGLRRFTHIQKIAGSNPIGNLSGIKDLTSLQNSHEL